MKKVFPAVLAILLLFLSACSTPTAEVTPTPEPTPSVEVTPEPTPRTTFTPWPAPTWWVNTPEPTPEPTPFLSYEDFFAQRIEYIDTDSDEPYFSPAGWNPYASTPEAAPGLALAQELITEDTLGWIPLTLSYTPDGSLYAFWAGTEEGASLYRLYYPTKTLECLYSITAEEVERRYYYTPQTEDTAYLFRSKEHPKGVIGERVCLMGYVDIYTNQEFLWGSYDPDFLTLLDDMSAHKEDYPQYPEWLWDTGDIVDWAEGELSLKLCHYFNAATEEYRVRADSFYGSHHYWWTVPDSTPFLSYEDYFAQTIDYGSIFDEENCYYDNVEWMKADDPALALVQELVDDDTLGLIPKTMHSVADRCLYVFWAGNEEGVYLYRLYYPTETLDLIYTIPAEEFEEKYCYTPQTEATAYFFRSSEYPDGAIGQKICLLHEVIPRSNYLYEWSCYNPEFLAKFDEMAAHKEDYPQYNWDYPYDELVPFIESNNGERWEEPFLYIGRCINASTGEYQEREMDTYSPDRYEIQW